MKDLLEYIVKNLVSKPNSVLVDEESGNGEVNLILTVDPTDMGLIIGKGGQTIYSIRKILTVRAIAENVRVNLQLSEPEGGSQREESNDKQPESKEDSTEESKVNDENPTENNEKSEALEEKSPEEKPEDK